MIMESKGTITTAGWNPNKAKTKDVFSFTFAPDDGSKHDTIYSNDVDLQALVTAMLHKHVTLDYDVSQGTGGREFKNIHNLFESPADAAPVAQRAPESSDARQSSIETQVAIKTVAFLVASGKMEKSHPAALKMFAWCDERIPEVKE